MIPSDPDRARSTERWRGRNRKEVIEGMGGWQGTPSALAYKLQSKELFHTRPNTCCHWQMYKCVNTPELTGRHRLVCGQCSKWNCTLSHCRVLTGCKICICIHMSSYYETLCSSLFFLYPRLHLYSFHPSLPYSSSFFPPSPPNISVASPFLFAVKKS